MATDAQTELIQSAVRGAAGALEELLCAYHRRVIRHIEAALPAALRSFCSAEDIAQETYIVVAREIRNFRPPFDSNAFFAWLLRIADHRRLTMLQMQRAAKRGGGRRPLSAGALLGAAGEHKDVIRLLELLAAHSRTPSRSVVRRETADAVGRALAQLRQAPQQALALRYIEGRSIAEICAAMKRTEAAVHMLCNRGLKRLRALLSE